MSYNLIDSAALSHCLYQGLLLGHALPSSNYNMNIDILNSALLLCDICVFVRLTAQ
jgi:hypothetical protein